MKGNDSRLSDGTMNERELEPSLRRDNGRKGNDCRLSDGTIDERDYSRLSDGAIDEREL